MWREWKEEPLTVQDFVLFHAIRIPVTTEADDHQSFLLAHNSLIDMPARDEMGEDERHDMDGDETDRDMVWSQETIGVRRRA